MKNFIKDLKVNCGGTEIYNQYGGYIFRRNKGDIEKIINVFYNGCLTPFILKDAYGYNKALIYTEKENPEHEILVSYNTIVAERIENEIKINGWYSRTTAQHINTYLYPITRKGYCKKDLEKEPTIYFE